MPSNNLYGFPQPLTQVFPAPILAQRAPISSDYLYPIGQEWVDEVGENVYFLVGVAANSATWAEAGGNAGPVDELTGDSGGAISPNSGNITLAGTANQITSIGSGSTITFSLIGPYTPATFTSHGVLTGAGTGSIVASTAGTNGQVFLGNTGSAPSFGTLTSSTGIAFTTGAGSLAINTTGGGLAATASSAAGPLTGATQSSYILANSGQVSVSLPATSAVGDFFIVCGTNANTGGVKITQATGQEIFATTNHTTSGATGNLATGAANTSIFLMCTAANTSWIVLNSLGTLTYT